MVYGPLQKPSQEAAGCILPRSPQPNPLSSSKANFGHHSLRWTGWTARIIGTQSLASRIAASSSAAVKKLPTAVIMVIIHDVMSFAVYWQTQGSITHAKVHSAKNAPKLPLAA